MNELRKTHLEQIERWANFVRTNPDWKKIHNQFIDSLFFNHDNFVEKLLNSPNGKEKLIKIQGIKNIKECEWLKS